MHEIQEGTGTEKLRNEEAVTDVGIPCYLSSIHFFAGDYAMPLSGNGDECSCWLSNPALRRGMWQNLVTRLYGFELPLFRIITTTTLRRRR